VLAARTPDTAEVQGLVALMELQASRLGARTDSNGEPILLLEQNRARWDHLLIRHGLAALERAEALEKIRGPYTLQAALAACHARAGSAAATDWARIVGLYSELAERHPSPVVDLNRAVALGMLMGPESGLAIVDALAEEGRLEGYHLLPAVRADFLQKLGRHAEAKAELLKAASLTQNEREKALLEKRASALPQDLRSR
jgi:predicted RNA polymerase sigma factor